MSLKILLVEDNDLNRDMLCRRLSKQGYKMLEAVDGLQVFDILEDHRPDVILMDLSLPKMDGWKVIRRLKGEANTVGIPIIALTAHALKSDMQGAFEAGCDDFDVKPIDFDRLIKKIEKVTPKKVEDNE